MAKPETFGARGAREGEQITMRGLMQMWDGDAVRKGLNMRAGTRSLSPQASDGVFTLGTKARQNPRQRCGREMSPASPPSPPWGRLSGSFLGAGHAMDMASSFSH